MVSEKVEDVTTEYNAQFGIILSNPAPEDAVVISGMSGIFPGSRNIDELKDNLYGKKELVSSNIKSTMYSSELPKKLGTIPRVDEYDPGNFGQHWRLSNYSDPCQRLVFETVFEAILDAGINPADLENTRTGIFIGSCFNEVEIWLKTYPEDQFSFYGLTKSSVSVRLGYILKTKGPVAVVDTACSSSLHALDIAFREIRMGHCDAAIVVASNLCLNTGVTIQFQRLGVLSREGKCKTFDESANGYVRSEAINVVILQKAKDAKRVYGEIIHSKSNSDGYKEQGITYPSGQDQKQLVEEIYQECGVPPSSLSYLEAHGTGTQVGDPEECNALDTFFCTNRDSPLPIGSIKSNLGHAEPASGLCSVIKVLLGFETGYIAPNLYYDTPNPNIQALIDGRMKVITEPTKINEELPLIGINSFGFGGSNAHVLLKSVTRRHNGMADDNLPRLVFVSGRSEEAIISLLDNVGHRPLDVDHIRLLQSSFSKYINPHHYRGYNIISKSGEIHRAVYTVTTLKVLPLYLVFGECINWETILFEFLSVPCFDETLKRVDTFLKSKSLSIHNTILNPKQEVRKQFNIFGSIMVQIGIADIIKTLKLGVTTVVGYSYGELLCAYYDNILTLNEVVNCALILNSEVDVNNSEQINGHAGTSKIFEMYSTIKDNLVKKLLSVLDTPRSWINGASKKKIASAEYFADAAIYKLKNLDEILQNNSLAFEVGLSSLEDVITNLENVKTFGFQSFESFLQTLGSLYFQGYLSAIDQLYPKVEFPVRRGTPIISSKIKWSATRKWWILHDSSFLKENHRMFSIDATDKSWEYITGHVIDGRNLFPASGYLHLVWITLAMSNTRYDCSLIFENCRFMRATTISNTKIMLKIQLSKSGYFEILEGSSIVMTGKITLKYNEPLELLPLKIPEETEDVMHQKDIYKELRLRGYNYSGEFRGIQKAAIDGLSGVIRYTNNWVTFLDSLFQLKILSQDSRNLYVPTSIDYIKIDCSQHQEYLNSISSDSTAVELDCGACYYKDVDVIRSAGVEVKGLLASPIQRRKNLGIPVLETYDFIPNNTNVSYENSIRINTQILLENTLLQKIKSIELVDSVTPNDPQVLSDMIITSFQDQPLIQPNAKVYTTMEVKTSVDVTNKLISSETDCALIIGSQLLSRPQILLECTNALKDNGFIISREPLDFLKDTVQNNITVITVHNTGKEKLVLIKKVEKKKPSVYIEHNDDPECTWLPKIQSAITNSDDVVVYSQNNPISGLLGFTNCLKREPGCENVRCILILDEMKQFDPNLEMFSEQLDKNLTINVYKDGQWGTFRHLLLNHNEESLNESYCAKVTVRGDLSSFKWMEGALSRNDKLDVEESLIDIYYCGLNFKDVMTATGKISLDVAHSKDRLNQDSVEGFEYSGIDQNGQRVMGVQNGSLANTVVGDASLIFKVPDSWSLKEAASVVCVYSTIAYAFLERCSLKKGESILIHSGTGGVGQAAIHLALHYGCNVFTTCGSKSKKEFLLKKFPQLKESQIGNSRNISFEKMIMQETDGRGVDYVLNSLADEKLIASVRCLAEGGKFLEIGKFDLANNSSINLLLLKKEATFHGVQFDLMFKAHVLEKRKLQRVFNKCLEDGAIKPLDVTVFAAKEIEQGFRYMASGKHMGKVVIEIRAENSPKPQVESLPRFYCKPEKSYVILGGLGGFGLELADWLILRGAKKIVLVSRGGIKNGYQKSRLRLWRDMYNLSIKVSTADVTTREGCEKLIQEANELGPIGGIFNLAVVLQDSIFTNQTVEMYQTSLAPKAYSTKYLDEITRKSCPQLDYFVVFSSVSCGRGNAGQTNYGMANSIMERICERRRKDGLPAVAIQWGAIGEVGLVAEMQENHKELEIGGTLQQRLSSCIEIMDILIKQKSSAIVSSIVVAEKKNVAEAENVSAAVANILGLDLKSVQASQTLAELGMDSMTTIEIKQVFEREYGIFLTSKDIRNLTFSKVKEFESNKSIIEIIPEVDDIQKDVLMSQALRLVIESAYEDKTLIELESNISKDRKAPMILMIPGIEGTSTLLKPLAKKLNAHILVSHYDLKNHKETIIDMAKNEISYIEDKFNKKEPVYIIGYSFGTWLALEAASYLEKKGYNCIVICLDGAPAMFKALQSTYPQNDADFDSELLITCISFGISTDIIAKTKKDIFNLKTLEEKLTKAAEIVLQQTKSLTEDQIKGILRGIVYRLKSVKSYDPRYSLKSRIVFFKATIETVKSLPADFYLEQTCGRSIEIMGIEGNHISILENDKLAEAINSIIKY